jgi:hypothetical protein
MPTNKWLWFAIGIVVGMYVVPAVRARTSG